MTTIGTPSLKCRGTDTSAAAATESQRDSIAQPKVATKLRYFEGKSAREIAQTLGVSDDAAQKRVSRAVERLREFLAKRGVTVGAGGLRCTDTEKLESTGAATCRT